MKVNFWYWFRAFVMTCGFIGTVFAIRKLDRTQGTTINLCPTRVKSISYPDQVAIVEDGMAWYRKIQGRMEELDPIAVERWFSANCRVPVKSISKAEDVAGAPLATFTYVSGSPEVIATTGEALLWMGQQFQADKLKASLSDLRDLPIRLRPSR